MANLEPNTWIVFCVANLEPNTWILFLIFSLGMSTNVTLKEVTDINIFQMSCSLMPVTLRFFLIHIFVVLDSHRQVTGNRRYSHLGNNTGLGFSS